MAKQDPPVFPPDIRLAPPPGGASPLPVAVVRDPPAERLLLKRTEAAPEPLVEPKTKAKTKKAGGKPVAKKRKATKTVRKTAKASPKTAAKTPRPRKPKMPKPVAAGIQPVLAEPVIMPVKDMAPALPPSIPLPRSAAVQAYRKNTPLDVIAYWLRKTTKSLRARFWTPKKPKAALPPPTISEMEGLRAENALLRQRIEQLLDSRAERERV